MTKLESLRHTIHDLIIDARSSNEAGQTDYAEACKKEAEAIYRQRHTCRIDQYGWPLLAKN